MDLKTAITLVARRYLAPTVVVLLILGNGMGYVWSEYKELNKEKERVAAERVSFYEERIASEKNRADMSKAMIEQKSELDKREFILTQLEGQNREKLATLKHKADEYEISFKKLEQDRASISISQRTKEAEENIMKLMSEFTAMGGNLNDTFRCIDPNALAKYNKAKAKYNEIYTLAEANGLIKKYNSFFFQNKQLVATVCIKTS